MVQGSKVSSPMRTNGCSFQLTLDSARWGGGYFVFFIDLLFKHRVVVFHLMVTTFVAVCCAQAESFWGQIGANGRLPSEFWAQSGRWTLPAYRQGGGFVLGNSTSGGWRISHPEPQLWVRRDLGLCVELSTHAFFWFVNVCLTSPCRCRDDGIT